MASSGCCPKKVDLVELFGKTTQLWSPSTQQFADAATVLHNKVVLLYFSAKWCGPCVRFTPLLKHVYQTLQSKGANVEVVYCSMDNFKGDYQSYTADMPWWCLPPQSATVGKLAARYRAEGIPHLIVVAADGELLCDDAVSEVMNDSDGDKFPWPCPQTLIEVLPETYLQNDGTVCPMSELDDKYLLLFFSASWSPPCVTFTPKLCKAYDALKETRDDFEMLFVSSDHDRRSFNEYFAEMTFCALPYGERDAKEKITKFLDIPGIPTLQIFGPLNNNGSIDRPLINSCVRPFIESGLLEEFPFHPKRYGDINLTRDNINDHKCIIVFHELGDDHDQEEIKEVIRQAADAYDGTDAVKFYWAFCNSGLDETLRSALRLGPVKDTPVMVLLDIPDGGAFYISKTEGGIVPETILEFIKSPGLKLEI